MYPLERFAVDLLRPEHVRQPLDAHYLTTIGFLLRKGVWVRKTALEPADYATLWEIPNRGRVPDQAEALLAAMERGEVEPPEGWA